MRAVVSVMIVAMLFIAAPAFAQVQNNSSGAHDNSQQVINATGGAGGAGGSATSSAAAAASATQGQQQSNTNVFVPTNVNSNTQGQHQGQDQYQGQYQGQAQGQKQNQNNHQTISPTQTTTIEASPSAPAIFAPNLTSSPEACMGSYSGGAGAGAATFSFGVSLGMTWTNQECQDRMTARTIASIGDAQAAREYLAAANPKVADAYKRAGVKVAVNEVAPTVAAAPVTEPGGVKQEKRDVAAVAAEGPVCGDQKPAKMEGWRYTCRYDR